MRLAPVLALVLLTGCASRHSTLSTAGQPPTVTSSPSASPRPATFPPRQPTLTQATTGTGYATVAGMVAVTTVTSTPPASSPPATTRTLLVTDGANGSSVRLHVGQRLEVRMTQATYDPATSTAEQTLARRSSTGGYPTTAPMQALFEAVASGHADVTASSDAACFHTQPRCMMPTRLWVVHVTVT